MSTITRETETYLSHFEELERELAGKGPSSLLPLRRQAMARFAELGFPTTKDEEWKYTSVAPIARTRFRRRATGDRRQHGQDFNVAPGRASDLPVAWRLASGACQLVFLNSLHQPALSTLTPLPPGVQAGSLGAALDTDFERVEAHLARYARFENQPFVALNTALMEDGAYIHIPRGVVVEEPIHLLFIGTADGDPIVAHPRSLIVAEENSQATVIETYLGVSGIYFTNAVTEIVAAENAVLEHYKVQRESEAAFHIASLRVQQERDSNVTSHSISVGGTLVRNDIRVVLAGPGGEATLNGLYIVNGRQHVDNHTAIDHAKPHCNSHELYKGILDGHSTAVFNGKIHVLPDAQKTDAKQTNQNLLLSRDAVIDTKPQLEIFADDVRCTHGATVGQLDADAVFYLRSRGIDLAEARGLLTYAFANDILERIKVAPLRAQLEELLRQTVGSGQWAVGSVAGDVSRLTADEQLEADHLGASQP
jgi:Fe-S cluster assembly protein SufD